MSYLEKFNELFGDKKMFLFCGWKSEFESRLNVFEDLFRHDTAWFGDENIRDFIMSQFTPPARGVVEFRGVLELVDIDTMRIVESERIDIIKNPSPPPKLKEVTTLFCQISRTLNNYRVYFSGWVTEGGSKVYFFNNIMKAKKKDVLEYFPPRAGYFIEFEGILEAYGGEDRYFRLLESKVEEIEITKEIPF